MAVVPFLCPVFYFFTPLFSRCACPTDYRLRLLYAIILVDVVAGAAVGPVLPEFIRGLREPQLWLSVGTGLFLGIQLFSSPLLGRLSDGYGRRLIFIFSAVGTLFANALL